MVFFFLLFFFYLYNYYYQIIQTLQSHKSIFYHDLYIELIVNDHCLLLYRTVINLFMSDVIMFLKEAGPFWPTGLIVQLLYHQSVNTDVVI